MTLRNRHRLPPEVPLSMRLRCTGAIRDSLLSIGKADLLTMTETRNQCVSLQLTRAATGGAIPYVVATHRGGWEEPIKHPLHVDIYL